MRQVSRKGKTMASLHLQVFFKVGTCCRTHTESRVDSSPPYRKIDGSFLKHWISCLNIALIYTRSSKNPIWLLTMHRANSSLRCANSTLCAMISRLGPWLTSLQFPLIPGMLAWKPYYSSNVWESSKATKLSVSLLPWAKTLRASSLETG